MIESAFPGGDGGGTVETITAGTGISVNSTDPANPIITNSAPGDTTYTVTTADCENTSLRVRMIDVTIPANTWADGERITIEVFRQMSNQSGSTFSSEAWIGGTGLVENTQGSQNVINNTITSAMHRFDFIRAGTTVYASRVFANQNFPFYYNSGFNLMSGSLLFALPQSTGVNFATNITLYIDHRWNSANATVYQRVLWAKCYKSSAGQQ
jgi:hypothetical protein